MQGWLKLNNELILWNKKTLKRIADTFPWPKHENKAVWTTYLPHAECIIISTKFYNELEETRSRILHIVGVCFDITGKYTVAEDMFRQALVLREKVFGSKQQLTLDTMNNLANVLDSQGKYADAEEIHRQTLKLYTEVLGAEHPLTIDSIGNLANTLDSQGKPRRCTGRHLSCIQRCLGQSAHQY